MTFELIYNYVSIGLCTELELVNECDTYYFACLHFLYFLLEVLHHVLVQFYLTLLLLIHRDRERKRGRIDSQKILANYYAHNHSGSYIHVCTYIEAS